MNEIGQGALRHKILGDLMDEELIEKNKPRLFWYAAIVLPIMLVPIFLFDRLETDQIWLFSAGFVTFGAASTSSMLHSMWRRIKETDGKSSIVLLSWKPFVWPLVISALVTSIAFFSDLPGTSVQMAMTLILIVTGGQLVILGANREAVKGTDQLLKIPRHSKAVHYGTILSAIGIVALHFVLPEQNREIGLFASGAVMVIGALVLIVHVLASFRMTRAFKRRKASSNPKERMEWLKYDAMRKWFRPILFFIMPFWLGGFAFSVFVPEIRDLAIPSFFAVMMVVTCHSMLFSLEGIPGIDLDQIKSRNRVRMFLSLSLVLGILGLGYFYPKDQQSLEAALIAIIVIYSVVFLFFAWRAVKASKEALTSVGDGGDAVDD